MSFINEFAQWLALPYDDRGDFREFVDWDDDCYDEQVEDDIDFIEDIIRKYGLQRKTIEEMLALIFITLDYME